MSVCFYTLILLLMIKMIISMTLTNYSYHDDYRDNEGNQSKVEMEERDQLDLS